MIEKWELASFPFEKDPLRYKLRVRGSEEDVQSLIQRLATNCGRPFVTLSQDYNWAFYIYALNDPQKEKVIEVLRAYSPNGKTVESSTLAIEKEIPPMLEDVLEAAAKSLIKKKEAKGVPEKKEIPEENPVSLENILSKAASIQAKPSEPVVSVMPAVQKAEPIPALTSDVEFVPITATPLNPRYIFSEFIVGPNNRFTHAAAQAVADNPGKIYNPFFIYGGVGLGKTHLMHAIGHTVLAKNPNLKYLYTGTENFASRVIEAIRLGKINSLREQFRGLDLLLIDDIQFLSGSESTQEEFFHVFNSLHEMGKQIVITSDRPPKLLSTLEDRLRSRFEWGLITDIKAPNLETRAAILKKKCEMIGIELGEDILLHIAERMKSNIRELEGVLKKVHAYVHLTNEKADLNLINSILEEAAVAPAKEPHKFAEPSTKVSQAPKPIEPSVAAKPPAPSPAKPVEPPVSKSASAAPPVPPQVKPVEPPKPAPIQDAPTKVSPPPVTKVEPVPPQAPAVETKKPEEKTADTTKSASEQLSSAFRKAMQMDTGKKEEVQKETSPAPAVAAPKPPVAPTEKVEAQKIETPKKESPPPVQSIIQPTSPVPPAKETIPPPAAAPASPIPAAASAPSAQKPAEPKSPSTETAQKSSETKPSAPAASPAASAASSSAAPSQPTEEKEEDVDPSLRPVEVVAFYPKSKEAEFESFKQKFRDTIKKHKLKFRIARLASKPYEYESANPDFSFFSKECQTFKCATALVLGPPPTPVLSEDDFAGSLNTLLDNEKISLQFIPWSEMTKDYRYLNCALDLSLSVPLHGEK